MTHQILHGDCLFVLREMPDNHVNLVYLDPPFFTQSKLSLKSKTMHEYSFADTWDSLGSYIEFLRERTVRKCVV